MRWNHFTLVGVLFITALSCTTLSCGQHKTAPADITPVATPAPRRYPLALVDNKKDLTCGMPLTAGIEDTLHYKGQVLGFCSKECKDEYVKNNPVSGNSSVNGANPVTGKAASN